MLALMDRAELIVRVEAGERFEYLFFWGHRQKTKGSPDASCLSQWFPAAFVVDGVRYATAEHWMMASKARLFGDSEVLARILEAASPEEAKALGRKVRGYDDDAWARARFDRVVEGNVAKFGQSPKLGAFLDATGERVLVEAAPRDCVWGIGLGRDNDRARSAHLARREPPRLRADGGAHAPAWIAARALTSRS